MQANHTLCLIETFESWLFRNTTWAVPLAICFVTVVMISSHVGLFSHVIDLANTEASKVICFQGGSFNTFIGVGGDVDMQSLRHSLFCSGWHFRWWNKQRYCYLLWQWFCGIFCCILVNVFLAKSKPLPEIDPVLLFFLTLLNSLGTHSSLSSS